MNRAEISDETTAERRFRALLDEMREYNFSTRYRVIRMCNVIRQPIVELQPTPKISGPWAEFVQPLNDGLSIFLDGFSSQEAEVELWRRCRDAILSARYSLDRSTRNFREFSEDELLEIKEVCR
jgi:hypothetical protein